MNAVCLVGHTTLRVSTLGAWDRPATAAERAAMRRRGSGDEGRRHRVQHVSSDPERSRRRWKRSSTARLVAEAGGVYSTTSARGDRVLDALEEAFAVGREGGVPVVVSHHKCVGPNNHGRSRETLAAFDRAGAPARWARRLPVHRLVDLPRSRSRPPGESDHHRVVARPARSGRTGTLRSCRGDGLSLEKACERLSPGGAVYSTMDEQDVRRVLAYPHTMIGSDGTPHDAHPHPRLWRTFPRVLGHYVRDVGLFPLEEAVRRMTSLPARRFGLSDRGLLKVGAYADLTLFDPETVIDRATFEQPQRPADGSPSSW